MTKKEEINRQRVEIKRASLREPCRRRFKNTGIRRRIRKIQIIRNPSQNPKKTNLLKPVLSERPQTSKTNRLGL